MPLCGFGDYLVSKLQTTGLENAVLIKFYKGTFLATGYETINFIKCLKGSIATRARISNISSRHNRREHVSRKPQKKEKEGKKSFFSKTPKTESI